MPIMRDDDDEDNDDAASSEYVDAVCQTTCQADQGDGADAAAESQEEILHAEQQHADADAAQTLDDVPSFVSETIAITKSLPFEEIETIVKQRWNQIRHRLLESWQDQLYDTMLMHCCKALVD